MSRRVPGTSVAAAGLLVVALTAAGCSGGGSDSTPGGSPASTASEPAVTTDVSFGSVTGRLPDAARQDLKSKIDDVVDGWMDAAYLGGDYPRADFSDSWPGFTAGAQKQAQGDGDLMSNRDVGDRIDGVEAKRRWLKIDVLAVKGKPVGVTAHVRLRFVTTGSAAADVRVAGRLYLTPGKQGWQVFGYDVTKGDAR